MRKKIEEHVKGSFKCIAFALVSGKAVGLLQMIPNGNKSFAMVYIDHKNIILRFASFREEASRTLLLTVNPKYYNQTEELALPLENLGML